MTWNGFEGLNRAEFRVEENVARLATIGASEEGSDKPMEVSDPTLDDIPQHFLKILEGEGYDLRQSESAHDDKFGL